jgi:hypothetical protein
MDAFESIVATLFEAEGFWVRRTVRVTLDRTHKRRPSAPRTELDLVAYLPAENELWIIECKSWLDSRGVKAAALINSDHKGAKRFKLFHDEEYYGAVSDALLKYLKLDRLAPRIRLCLVAGKIADKEQSIKAHFQKLDWEYRGPEWVRHGLEELAKGAYKNDAATVTVKLLRNANVD